jgi:uncharacterized low-complexity protein
MQKIELPKQLLVTPNQTIINYFFKGLIMNNTQKSIALAISGAFALSIAASAVNAAENPFAAKSLANGYQVADNTTGKMKDGKCAAGKCGANKKAAMEKAAMEKSKEGKCSAEKMKEGACSAEMKKEAESKAKEGKCSAEKAKEGKCSAEKAK